MVTNCQIRIVEVERRCKSKGKVVMFGGGGDDEYSFYGVMRADNDWIFSNDKDEVTWMGPKPESLWWTCTHTSEDARTLKVGGSRGEKSGPAVR